MVPLGQFRNTFIIAVDEEGIAIIDQHVAHERILFELMERLAARALESQRLITPLVLERCRRPSDAARASGGHWSDSDSRSQISAARAFEVVPCRRSSTGPMRGRAARRRQRSRRSAPGASVNEALRRLAATMACHAAVKANDRLTREKMQYLLDELRRTAHSSVCPHGRPVVLRLTRREVEKKFRADTRLWLRWLRATSERGLRRASPAR